MAIRNRISGAAKRADPFRDKGKVMHPLLQPGSRHYSVWQTIVIDGNPRGGVTAAQIASANHNYHPQVLADLQRHKLIAKNGRLARHFRYIGDPTGRGINLQTLTIDIDLLETEDGSFVTRTTLLGRQDNLGRVVRHLCTKRVTIDVPLGGTPVQGDVKYDAEPDFAEIHRAKRGRRDNVIIEASAQHVEAAELPNPTLDELSQLDEEMQVRHLVSDLDRWAAIILK